MAENDVIYARVSMKIDGCVTCVYVCVRLCVYIFPFFEKNDTERRFREDDWKDDGPFSPGARKEEVCIYIRIRNGR